MSAWSRPHDSTESLESTCQRVALDYGARRGANGRRRLDLPEVPAEVLAAAETCGFHKVVCAGSSGVAHGSRFYEGIIYDALLEVGMGWLDDALPGYGQRRVLDENINDPPTRFYHWYDNPYLSHTCFRLSLHVPRKLYTRIKDRSLSARFGHTHVLAVASMVAGMAQSEFWLPRRGPLAAKAIRHWLAWVWG